MFQSTTAHLPGQFISQIDRVSVSKLGSNIEASTLTIFVVIVFMLLAVPVPIIPVFFLCDRAATIGVPSGQLELGLWCPSGQLHLKSIQQPRVLSLGGTAAPQQTNNHQLLLPPPTNFHKPLTAFPGFFSCSRSHCLVVPFSPAALICLYDYMRRVANHLGYPPHTCSALSYTA